MRKQVFAVCDYEEEYAWNLMNYFERKRMVPFELHGFTDVDHLLSFASNREIEILLISQRAMCQEVEELNIKKIVILSQENSNLIQDGYPRVYKYQSSAQVLREVMNCYGVRDPAAGQSVPKENYTLIGVYSPVSRCGKTLFSLSAGQILSAVSRTLYVNMEEYCAYPELHGNQTQGLDELLYLLEERDEAARQRLPSMVRSIHSMDYLPAVKNPGDIRSVSWKLWEKLLTLLEQSVYETVLLDIGCEVDGLFWILSRCHRIYQPILSDPGSQAKLKHFERLMETWEGSALSDKVVAVSVPFEKGLTAEEEDKVRVEKLAFGEIGNYVRAVLKH